MEEARIFVGDDKAWQHVCKQAAAGSPLHLRALLFLGQESPNELTAICEMWRSFLPRSEVQNEKTV